MATAAASIGLAGCKNAGDAGDRAPSRQAPGIVEFYGSHQPGIATAAQQHLHLAALDLQRDEAGSLRDLLVAWSASSARLMANEPASGNNRARDTGETDGVPPARLSITIGLGDSLFQLHDRDRLGMARLRPTALASLPRFRGEDLQRGYSGGDLCIQVCADDPQVAFHAVHSLTRVAAGVATPRWTQEGFRPSALAGTPRNLMGFKDGTSNIDTSDRDEMARHVWVGASDEPAWMRGGTYLVARRIRTLLDVWDNTSLAEQEATIGRHKANGAPLGRRHEHDGADLSSGNDGAPTIPLDAHIRLAAPESNDGVRLLRRSYNYTDGVDIATGQPEAGLLFLCYQRDPHRQFVPVQRRLAQHDALNKHVLHVGSAVFACPPGAQPNGYIGERLFDASG